MLSAAHLAIAAIDPAGRSRGELCDQIAALAAVESHLTERRLAVTAAIDALDDGGVDGAGVNRAVGRCSGRRGSQLAATSSQLGAMPATRASLAAGAITPEHADAAARAATDVDASRADTELVESAQAMPADLFARKAREWVGRNQDPADAEERYAAQRRDRTAKTWIDNRGMFWLLLGIDAVAGKEIDERLKAKAESLWRDDGGRDGTPDEVRSPDQRRADAVHELMSRDAVSATPGRHPRHQMTALADASRLRTDDPAGFAAIVDGEPLPQSVLERLACDAAITAVLFDGPGSVLWQSRDTRTATIDQWRALIARDRGCVLCGISPSRCEAHHIIPWLDLGPTDITNLALVCTAHHHLIHDTNSMLDYIDGVWRLRSRDGPMALAA